MTDIRRVVPRTPAGVLELLRSLLDQARADSIAGLVVLVRYTDGRGYHHDTAGDLDLGDLLVMIEDWKHRQFESRMPKGRA